jgi:tetratricopeptide (TPR) repeat protein
MVEARSAPREPLASPTDADLERARSLYAEGRELYLRGNWGGAIVAFEYSYELSGDPNLLYNISLCYDRLSAFEQAIEYLNYYRELAPPAEHADLDAQIDSLQGRLEAQRSQGRPADARPLSEPGLGQPPSPGEAPADVSPEPPRGPRVMTPGLIALAAAGSVAFVVAAGTGPASLVATSRAKDSCSSNGGQLHCRDSSADEMSRARSLAIATDVALGVGAATTVVFVALLATRIKKIRRGQVAWSPALGGAALSLRF